MNNQIACTPLSNEQIVKLLDQERAKWSNRTGPPTYDFAVAFAKAIENLHFTNMNKQYND